MSDNGIPKHRWACPRCGERARLAGGWDQDTGRERAYQCRNATCQHWFGTLETVLIPHMGKIGETAEEWNRSK